MSCTCIQTPVSAGCTARAHPDAGVTRCQEAAASAASYGISRRDKATARETRAERSQCPRGGLIGGAHAPSAPPRSRRPT
eukprot:1671155-Rhodomonas_salina.2